MNLFRNQLGYAVWGVGHRQRGFLLQFLGSTVRGYGTGENYFPDAMPFGKGTDVLRTTDICFKICRIGMTGSAMNGGEVKDHIIGSDIYFFQLYRLSYITIDECGCMFLPFLKAGL